MTGSLVYIMVGVLAFFTIGGRGPRQTQGL